MDICIIHLKRNKCAVYIYYGGNNELEFLAMSALPEINQFRRRGLRATGYIDPDRGLINCPEGSFLVSTSCSIVHPPYTSCTDFSGFMCTILN